MNYDIAYPLKYDKQHKLDCFASNSQLTIVNLSAMEQLVNESINN